MRINMIDVDAMFARLVRNMQRHNLLSEGESAHLEWGSRTNGNSYKVSVITADNRRVSPFGTLSFGFSKASCYETMHTLSVALEMVPETVQA
jgi:hypothetical protein